MCTFVDLPNGKLARFAVNEKLPSETDKGVH
jgi:hypothetical protein